MEKQTTYVGMDVHVRTIRVAVLERAAQRAGAAFRDG